jgi:orotidine-5'-phosphate decarboxylase
MTPEQARNKIIFALDVNNTTEIDRFAEMLSGRVGMFKVGKELFTTAGPEAVRAVQRHAGQVFLDLKYHDIPNTVAKASVEAARLGARFVDMHALGGAEMMGSAVAAVHKEFGEQRPKLLAITILTSSTAETLQQIGIEYPLDQMVVRLARLAKASGMDGVVASPLEIGLIREACGPDFLIVTPGVRPSFAAVDDQKRIMSPADAVRAGADYLVIGRPIAKAADPAHAAQLIVDEIVAGCP